MSNSDNSLEQELQGDSQDVKMLFEAIQKSDKPQTSLALVHQTGLSTFEVEDGLKVLMKKYPCRLEVSKVGELVYHFILDKEEKFRKPILAQLLGFAALLFRFVFKLWIVLMVYTFGIVYGAVIAILAVAISKSATPLLFFVVGLFVGIKELIMGIFNFFRYWDRSKAFNFSSNNILYLTFGYVFGQPAEEDKLALEKRILTYLHNNNNIITATELALLTGWSLDRAEEEMAALMARYRAEPWVTEEGIIIYKFPEGGEATEDSLKKSYKWQFIWSHLPTYARWTPEDISGSQIILNILVGIALVVSIVLTIISTPIDPDFWDISLVASFQFFNSFWPSYFSLAFCLLFFTIPMLGKARLHAQNKKIAKFRLRAIWLYHLVNQLPDVLKGKLYKDPNLEKTIDQLRLDYRGEPANDAAGNIIFRFQFMHNELQAIAKERNEKFLKLDRPLGKDSLTARPKGSLIGGILKATVFCGLILGGAFFLHTTLNQQRQTGHYAEWISMLENPEDVQVLDLRKWYNWGEKVQGQLEIFTNLEELHLAFSTKELPEALPKLKKLRKLDCSKANIKDWQILAELTELEELDLQDCDNIYGKTLASIESLTKLKVLDLRKAEAGGIINSLVNLKQLERLDLRGAKYRAFPDEILQLPNLKWLAMEGTGDYRTKTLIWPDLTGKFQNLETLHINYGIADTFPAQFFELPKLKEFYLKDYNPENDKDQIITKGLLKLEQPKALGFIDSKSIPEVVYSLTSLEKMDISGYYADSLPEEIVKLVNLKELVFHRAKKAVFPLSFRNLEKLETLDMSSYYADDFPLGLVENLSQLKTLKLIAYGPSLEILPAKITQLENLEILYINGNYDKVPPILGKLKNLKEVHLEEEFGRKHNKQESIQVFSPNTKVYFDIDY